MEENKHKKKFHVETIRSEIDGKPFVMTKIVRSNENRQPLWVIFIKKLLIKIVSLFKLSNYK
jgi:hypothetical protein